jgi:hypothetical protein
MSGVVVEKRSANYTKYGFLTIFGLNEGRRERRKLGRWENEKVGKKQD